MKILLIKTLTLDIISNRIISLSGIISLVETIVTIGIGILAYQKIPDKYGKLISIGAALITISYLSGILTSFFGGYFNGWESTHNFFMMSSVLGMMGRLLFLIGIFMLLKYLVYKEEETE